MAKCLILAMRKGAFKPVLLLWLRNNFICPFPFSGWQLKVKGVWGVWVLIVRHWSSIGSSPDNSGKATWEPNHTNKKFYICQFTSPFITLYNVPVIRPCQLSTLWWEARLPVKVPGETSQKNQFIWHLQLFVLFEFYDEVRCFRLVICKNEYIWPVCQAFIVVFLFLFCIYLCILSLPLDPW